MFVVERGGLVMSEVPERSASAEHSTPAIAARDPWLRVIAGFKLAKASFLLAAAVAALGLLNARTPKPISHRAMAVAADRHYEIAEALVAGLLNVDPRTLHLVSAGSLVYSVLFYTEGSVCFSIDGGRST